MIRMDKLLNKLARGMKLTRKERQKLFGKGSGNNTAPTTHKPYFWSDENIKREKYLHAKGLVK